MKIFIVLATILACAFAKPGYVGYTGFPFGATTYTTGYPYAAAPITYAAAPAITYSSAPAVTYAAAPAITYAAAPAVVAPAFTKTQYHAQDELGQASYGHAHPGQAHSAIRDAFGNVRGAYAYVNPEGKEIRVAYTAGHGGFQVESNALPQAPVHVLPEPLVAPSPVADTAEVKEAKEAHFKAVEEAKARNAAAGPEEPATAEASADTVVTEAEPEKATQSRKKRGIVYAAAAAPVVTAAVPVATSTSYSYRYDAPKTVAYAAAVPAVKTYSSYYSPLLGSSLYRYPAVAAPLGYGYSSYYL